jgi:hydroxyacylglutathione hydrolase
MKLIALPAFADNYIWMLHNGRDALVVDPGDAAPVLAALARDRLNLAGILVTHHHADHVGGLAALLASHPAPVFGPARERLPVPVQPVCDGQCIELLGQSWQVLDVPGHTAGHVAYFAHGHAEAPILFCGDTLFSGGCGRLFEGSPSQMHASLSRLAALPAATQVCCAHEYTLANLRFALALEADNPALNDYAARCRATRDANLPTLPAALGLELQINPFLRCGEAAIRDAARQRDPAAQSPVEVFAALRLWKNEFR